MTAPTLEQRAAAIRLLGLDVDGTLTDGRLWFGAEGEVFKGFHVQDGLGLKLLAQAGIEVMWITARQSRIVAARAADLGIAEVVQASRSKRVDLLDIAARRGLTPEQLAFMGDDLHDLPAFGTVGLAVAPANAHPWILEHVHWQTTRAGGEGAVRELCDLLLTAQGHRTAIIDGFLAK